VDEGERAHRREAEAQGRRLAEAETREEAFARRAAFASEFKTE